MKTFGNMILMSSLILCGKVFALGVDVGPVHVHTDLPSVHVHTYATGVIENCKIVVDTVVKDEDTRKIVKIIAHRKGDSEDTFAIKVSRSDLDDDSIELINDRLESGTIYKVRMEKFDEHWKLLKIRKNEDD